jgi:hypothetical protein
MADLLFVAIVVAFFAVTVAYVKGCELVVGPDVPLPDEPLDPGALARGADRLGTGEGAAAVPAVAGTPAARRGDGDR